MMKSIYRSARNNCGYKTLRFLHFGVIFFKMRFLIMRFSSQTRFNKGLYEISAVLNYAIVQQLAFFAFVCITQLFLALRYLLTTTPTSHTHRFHPLPLATPTSCSPHPLATPIHSTHSPQLLSILLTLQGRCG